jgi:hypothetical protein
VQHEFLREPDESSGTLPAPSELEIELKLALSWSSEVGRTLCQAEQRIEVLGFSGERVSR